MPTCWQSSRGRTTSHRSCRALLDPLHSNFYIRSNFRFPEPYLSSPNQRQHTSFEKGNVVKSTAALRLTFALLSAVFVFADTAGAQAPASFGEEDSPAETSS